VKRERERENSLSDFWHFPFSRAIVASRSIKPTTGATQVDDCFGKNRHCMSRISDTQMLRGKSNDSLCNKEKKKQKTNTKQNKNALQKKFCNCF